MIYNIWWFYENVSRIVRIQFIGWVRDATCCWKTIFNFSIYYFEASLARKQKKGVRCAAAPLRLGGEGVSVFDCVRLNVIWAGLSACNFVLHHHIYITLLIIYEWGIEKSGEKWVIKLCAYTRALRRGWDDEFLFFFCGPLFYLLLTMSNQCVRF